MANLSCTQWKHYTLSYFQTDYYCHHCCLSNFYKSPFKLNDSDPLPRPRHFPGPWTKCSLRPLSPSGWGPLTPGTTVKRGRLSSACPTASRHIKCTRGLRQCQQPSHHPIQRLQQVTHWTGVKLVLGCIFGGYSLGSSHDFAEVRPVLAAGGR